MLRRQQTNGKKIHHPGVIGGNPNMMGTTVQPEGREKDLTLTNGLITFYPLKEYPISQFTP